MEIADEGAAAKAAVSAMPTAGRLAGRFIVQSAGGSTPMIANARLAAPTAVVQAAASAAMTAAVAANATSASIPCGGSGACSVSAPGAARAAAAPTTAKRSATHPIATTLARVTATGPVAAGAPVAIMAATTRRATFRPLEAARRSRMIRRWSPRRPLRQPRRRGGSRPITTIVSPACRSARKPSARRSSG
jgi:hypothetical protein